jgi:L-aspartate oxidase
VHDRADFLIIGSGIAGLRAATDLADHGDVIILTKADPAESNTGYAQGGIAAAIGAEDTPEEHFADTMAAGDGLCDEDAVRVMVEDGVDYVRQLIEWGAAFDCDAAGQPALAREGGHRVRRVLHARDATGREIGRLLWQRVSRQPRARVLHHARAIALDVRGGHCVGARFSRESTPGDIEASAVLLATGGAGQVYSETTNPPIATGDGIALAWRAEARVADLEFVQFHPTALAVAGAPRFLLSEALRGEGARLVNRDGDRFMPRYQPSAELAPRDLVARAIAAEAARTGGPVFLSLQHLDPDWVHARFPTISEACHSAGLDLARDLIPVGPAAHYLMGGVETDVWGRTTVPGLYAAGEVACTGVHGANRLASNSLLEGLVFGARAAIAMRERPRGGGMPHVRAAGHDTSIRLSNTERSSDSAPNEHTLRSLMWKAVGVNRVGAALEEAVKTLRDAVRHLERDAANSPGDQSHGRLASIATVGRLIATAALRREESRGAHFRTDFAARDDLHWRIHLAQKRHSNG